MFDFDATTEGGSKGPWVRWSSDGSAKKGFPPKTFVIRGTDANENKFEKVFEQFSAGVCINLDSVQQGWMKDNGMGQAPTRLMDPSPKRPDDSKKQSGSYAWSRMFVCRIAIGGGEMATWEDAGWGGYEGFRLLAVQIQHEVAGNPGKCPIVALERVEDRNFNNGSTAIPHFKILKWVAPPACFAEDGKFDTAPAETGATPPVQNTPPADNSALAEDMTF